MNGSAGHAGDWAIDLHDVQKVYRRGLFGGPGVHALRGVAMRVARGEIFGLLGPNGAGKSTLVKILMTVIRATQARGTVLGLPVGHKPALAKIGYLPEHHKFPEYLTGAQVVDLYAALAGVERRDRRRRTPELLELVGMREWGAHKVRGYSKGMRQRVGIAQALACDPDLVVLDEPTDGVDPVGRRDIRLMLQRIKEQGKTVFLNSHLLSELEMVCDRVGIMVQGKVTSQGMLDALTASGRAYTVELAHDSPQDAGALEAVRERTPGATVSGRTIRLPGDDPASVQPVIDELRRRGVAISAVRPVRPSLEDLFMEAVTDKETGGVLGPGAKR